MTHGTKMLFTGILALVLMTPCWSPGAEESAKRGEYLARAANCEGCHQEESPEAAPYAGGRALKTPFGTFYGPNITPHRDAGIGRWSEADFIQSMRFGQRPDGAPYFPAFPYPSYTHITDSDLRDLWAYLRTIAPDGRISRHHDLGLFFQWRFPVRFWNLLFFTKGPLPANPDRTPVANRGAYLVQALGHCGECHTPRNVLGAPKRYRHLAGGKNPEGKKTPNLTPARLKKWSDRELEDYLATGITPDGDIAGETMGEVIRNSLTHLTKEDLEAIVHYLRSLPELH